MSGLETRTLLPRPLPAGLASMAFTLGCIATTFAWAVVIGFTELPLVVWELCWRRGRLNKRQEMKTHGNVVQNP